MEKEKHEKNRTEEKEHKINKPDLKEHIQEDKEEIKAESGEDKIKKQEKHVRIFITGVIIVSLIIIVAIASLYLSYKFASGTKSFEFAGLTWQKEMFGKLPIYTTLITAKNYNGDMQNFKINLKNDPRKVNVPVEGNVSVIGTKKVYLSIDLDSELNTCSDATVALVSFGQVMTGIGFELETAVNNREKAELYSRSYVDCTTHQNNTVFVLSTSNASGIVQDKDNKNCYHIKVGNCDVINVLEKLDVSAMENLKNSGNLWTIAAE